MPEPSFPPGLPTQQGCLDVPVGSVGWSAHFLREQMHCTDKGGTVVYDVVVGGGGSL